MADNDIALMAHLMRRAGFGATRDELEAYVAKGYDAAVEELLQKSDREVDYKGPFGQTVENQTGVDVDLMERYLHEYSEPVGYESSQQGWLYIMINSKRPLQEKLALFWHGILCSAYAKVDNGRQLMLQIDMFRRHSLGNFRDLLLELSKETSNLYFLDNVDNHKTAVNENWGRELLELFSLGVGMDGQSNYTEDDVKACSRAFTGWTVEPTLPIFPYGRIEWEFCYDPTDHDFGEKTFLGETGRWNGEDIIDIIVRQPAAARFVSRHLYNFFVADEPQVPAWKDTPPRDMEAIRTLEKTFIENGYEMLPVLRTLFKSDFFKNARFTKVKSPTEVVVGTLRLVKDHTEVKPGLAEMTLQCVFMGQDLLNPPSVEGWHTGKEWIDSGTLVERINFVADQVGNLELPGIKLIADRMSAGISTMPHEEFVDGCLDLIGPVEVTEETRVALIEHAAIGGELKRGTEEERIRFARRVAEMLQLIVATEEYQYA